ncbi:hypothetical protein GCM10007216_09570 [Thalassobacillus devorans]|uniref:DUF3993 domain-containing protein n=1 Tax=Thalassobacillus devorans TaxID=279813 RepID=A0ABQ1NNP3_9BACI|nr:hypothetical protein [Thalassobacillus devorans]NIK29104.1 hypothetical protein [Thalassobacillus devorans]GGC81133.1 hypothetical protein GCM10007216_09570 [Thalassobacillus devorans]
MKKTSTAKLVKSIVIAVPLALFVQTGASLNAEEPKQVNMHQEAVTDVEVKTASSNEKESKESLGKATIEERTDQFMEHLVQETDENYKVLNYDSKEALLDGFEPIATRQAAKEYVDFYYKEKQSGLYILPTETPPWFVNGQPYDTIDIDKNHKKVIQKNNNELYGDYKIAITFIYDGEWRIQEIEHK